MVEKIIPADRKRITFVEASEAGRQMIRRKCKTLGTKLNYCRSAVLFSEFLGKGIDEIVNEYKRDIETNLTKAWEKWEETFAEFADYLEKQHPEGGTARTYFEGAKALINANVPKSARIKPEAPKRYSRTIPPITIEDLRKVRKITDERESAFIDFLKDSGISEMTLSS